MANVTALKIIKMVEEQIGNGKLIGVRPRLNSEFELTLENKETCEELLTNGIYIEGHLCETRKLCVTEMVVSFLNLLTYGHRRRYTGQAGGLCQYSLSEGGTTREHQWRMGRGT